jgi:hypothetical protein
MRSAVSTTPIVFRQPFRRAVEFVSEDAECFRDDGLGDGQIDLSVDRQIDELLRFAAELQCADENVGVSDDPLHERARDSWTTRSTSASTSAPLVSPRRRSPSWPSVNLASVFRLPAEPGAVGRVAP